MKPFKEEINEEITSFTKPVSQMFNNIGYSISDTISDAIADREEQAGKYDTSQKNGCLWRIIKWILILSVVSAALSECSGGYSSSSGNGAQSSAQAIEGVQITETKSMGEAPESIDNIYELIIASTKSNIATILAGEQPDMVELQSEYEFLLFFKINEYMYKASAYGYYTGDYESNHFADIMMESDTIRQEMKMYFPEDEVEEYFTGCALLAYQSYDEKNIDYDTCLIGSKSNPDVDAMWLNYVDTLAENAGWNIQNEIDAHGMDMYSTLIPTESTEISDNRVTTPTQNMRGDESYIVGYVMYDIGGGLNIRTGPDVDYEKVGRMPEGEQVIIWETHYSGTAEWGRIDQGWICMDYIRTDVPTTESMGISTAEDTFEADFFYINLPDKWNEKYVVEHSYSVRSEYIVFYYESEYQYYQETYSEPGGWPFALEIRSDGTACSVIAGWNHIGTIFTSDGYTYELYLHYPMDPQFMDGSYNTYLDDAGSIIASIVCKDGYSISWYN